MRQEKFRNKGNHFNEIRAKERTQASQSAHKIKNLIKNKLSDKDTLHMLLTQP